MPELIMPRNEKELCGLFEDLLFMRTEKFPGFLKEKSDDDFKLNEGDLGLLRKTGITGRIFRRWFQTTWGLNSWSVFFSGETPRQELGHYYPGPLGGNALLYVEMEERNKKWRVIPRLFLKKDIGGDGGVFSAGLKNIKLQSLAPSFDFGFKKFAEYMLQVERLAQSLRSYNPPRDEEEKWWKLFWEQIGASLAFNIQMELPPKQLIKIAFEIQKFLDYFVQQQGRGTGDFIEIDNLFAYLWDILMGNDKRLLPYALMIDKNEKIMDARMNEPGYLYSTKIFYLLGHIFDEKILFPIDVYFGGAECVWTDHQNFLGAMINTTLLLKNNLAPPKKVLKLNPEEKKQMDYLGVTETAFNIERTWFAPPTVFRLLPSVMRYF